jgi:hypothetical protein
LLRAASRLSRWRRQHRDLSQHAGKQPPRQMALRQESGAYFEGPHGGITKMAESHLNSNELALELTKLTLQYHTASNTSWVTLASDPDKWGAYVRDVYDKCLKGLKKD